MKPSFRVCILASVLLGVLAGPGPSHQSAGCGPRPRRSLSRPARKPFGALRGDMGPAARCAGCRGDTGPARARMC